MSAPTCCTIGHGNHPALREVFVYDGHDGAWFPYCLDCAETLRRSGEKVRPIYGTASFRSDDGPGYPDWTLARRQQVLSCVEGHIATADDGGQIDLDLMCRVLYDLLHEDGR